VFKTPLHSEQWKIITQKINGNVFFGDFVLLPGAWVSILLEGIMQQWQLLRRLQAQVS
jgi:hypothetical protein